MVNLNFNLIGNRRPDLKSRFFTSSSLPLCGPCLLLSSVSDPPVLHLVTIPSSASSARPYFRCLFVLGLTHVFSPTSALNCNSSTSHQIRFDNQEKGSSIVQAHENNVSALTRSHRHPSSFQRPPQDSRPSRPHRLWGKQHLRTQHERGQSPATRTATTRERDQRMPVQRRQGEATRG